MGLRQPLTRAVLFQGPLDPASDSWKGAPISELDTSEGFKAKPRPKDSSSAWPTLGSGPMDVDAGASLAGLPHTCLPWRTKVFLHRHWHLMNGNVLHRMYRLYIAPSQGQLALALLLNPHRIVDRNCADWVRGRAKSGGQIAEIMCGHAQYMGHRLLILCVGTHSICSLQCSIRTLESSSMFSTGLFYMGLLAAPILIQIQWA